MPIAKIIGKMTEYSNGNRHDIDHFMRVWAFAKTIAELEGILEETMLIIETAAIVHDIACPLCREKYGSTEGKYQETEGEILAAEFLADSGLNSDEIERVAYLVGHHHTVDGFYGLDHQILVEADFLANAEENGWPAQWAEDANAFFKTKTGLDILASAYRV